MKKYLILLSALLFWSFPSGQGLKAQNGKQVALETLGATAAIAMYNTYITIGALADGYSEEVYKSDYVIDLAKEQVSAMERLIAQYEELLASGFVTDASDKEFIEEMNVTFGYLKQEAKGLIEIANGDDSGLYDEARDNAWEKISQLLGIGEGE